PRSVRSRAAREMTSSSAIRIRMKNLLEDSPTGPTRKLAPHPKDSNTATRRLTNGRRGTRTGIPCRGEGEGEAANFCFQHAENLCCRAEFASFTQALQAGSRSGYRAAADIARRPLQPVRRLTHADRVSDCECLANFPKHPRAFRQEQPAKF